MVSETPVKESVRWQGAPILEHTLKVVLFCVKLIARLVRKLCCWARFSYILTKHFLTEQKETLLYCKKSISQWLCISEFKLWKTRLLEKAKLLRIGAVSEIYNELKKKTCYLGRVENNVQNFAICSIERKPVYKHVNFVDFRDRSGRSSHIRLHFLTLHWARKILKVKSDMVRNWFLLIHFIILRRKKRTVNLFLEP